MTQITLSNPRFATEDVSSVIKILKNGKLVQGVNVLDFENKISNLLNMNYASCVSSGTAALHLALIACGVGRGDEVIVPAFSFIATANVIELCGAKPTFVDINIDTFNIDINQIESLITRNTKAIMPVHEFGLACDLDQIMSIAAKYNLYVIEDAACALGSFYKNKPVGTFGNCAAFSFHPRKIITCGEGGVLVSNDEKFDITIKKFRNHGIESSNGAIEFDTFGLNYRLTDFQAALIRAQIDRLELIISHKDKLADLYNKNIDRSKYRLPTIPEYAKPNWQTYHILCDERLDQKEIFEKLKSKNIEVNYGAQCIPYTKAYQKKYRYDCKKLYPNALRAFNKGIAIPIHEKLTESQIEYVANTLNEVVN